METDNCFIYENRAFIFIIRNFFDKLIVERISFNIFGLFHKLSSLCLFFLDWIIFFDIFFKHHIGRVINPDSINSRHCQFIKRFFNVENNSLVKIMLIAFSFERKIIDTQSKGLLVGIEGFDLNCCHLEGWDNSQFDKCSEMGYTNF